MANFEKDTTSNKLSTEVILARLRQALDADPRTDRRVGLDAGLGPNFIRGVFKESKTPSIEKLVQILNTLGDEATTLVLRGDTLTGNQRSGASGAVNSENIQLKRLRKSAGLSQTQLAEQSGVDPSLVSKIENGFDGATLKTFRAICSALDCTMSELFREPKSETVSGRLSTIRSQLGLSAKDFSSKAGLTYEVYWRFETGKRPLTIEAAKRLKITYGISLDYLYFGEMGGLPQRIAEKM